MAGTNTILQIFQKVAKGYPGTSVGNNEASRKWFRNAVQKMTGATPPKHIFDGNDRSLIPVSNYDSQLIGKMLMFNYDPKHKETLPYYDTYPVIFAIDEAKDGFLGINLHYLPPVSRAKLMDALYGTLNNPVVTPKAKLEISYRILKGASRYRLFKPCVKHYLSAHVRSKLFVVPPAQWDLVMALPLQRFRKASAEQVWAESMAKVRQ